jgi:hypothetical protein
MTLHIALTAGITILVLLAQQYFLLALYRQLGGISVEFLATLPSEGKTPTTIQKWSDVFRMSATTLFVAITTREHVKERVDEYVYSLGPYRFLQKLAILAPVIGVMLTGLGFLLLEAETIELGALAAPLASGVLAGCLLGMTNQAVLYLAESRMIQVVDSMHHELATRWANIASRLGEPTEHFREASSQFDSAVHKLTAIIGSFPSNAASLNQRFLEVENLARASVATLNSLDERLRISADSFRDVSDKLANAASDEFVAAVHRLQQSVDTLGSTADSSKKSALDLESTANSLASFADTYIKEYAGLSRRMQELVEQTSDSIRRLTQALNHSANSISEPILLTASRLSQVGDASERSAQAANELTRVSLLLKQFIETTSQPAKDTFEQLKRMSTEIGEAYAGVGALLEKLDAAGSEQVEAQQIFLHLIKRRALPAVEVLQRATGTFEDSAISISESSEQLAEILERLSRIGMPLNTPLREIENGSPDEVRPAGVVDS